MKILLTATVQSHICQFHKPLVKVLHECGCEVHVAARNNLVEKNGLELNFADKVYNIPFSRSPRSVDNLKAYKILKKLIEEGNYDIIHCNTPMGGVVTRLAARKVRKRGTKVFYTAHGFHFYEGAPKKNWLIYYPIEKMFARMTDKLITITMEDYNIANKKFKCDIKYIHGVGADSSKFTLLTDEEKDNLKKRLGFCKETKIVLNVGELLPNKNQLSAIRAMEIVIKKVPNSILLVAGNGPEKNRLQKVIDEKGLSEKIILLGYTTKLQEYMSVSDVLIACSYREGLPVTLIEAMLCKKPIVASMNRGHKELVQSGKNGFLVQPEDIKGYAADLLKLLLNDDEKKQMGEVGYGLVSNFTDENVMKELKEIYEL